MTSCIYGCAVLAAALHAVRVISSRSMHIDQLYVRSRLIINVRVIISDFSIVYTLLPGMCIYVCSRPIYFRPAHACMSFLMDFLKNNEG